MFESLLLNIAIFHQNKAIKQCKTLRQQYLDKGEIELASYMVNVLVDQETVLTYLKSEKERVKNEKKEERNK